MQININIPGRRLAALAGAVVIGGFALVACDSSSDGSTQSRGQNITEKYSARLEKAEPYPLAQMKDSLERKNLREKLLRYNNPNKVSYIYLLSMDGKVIAHFVIKGKVTNNSSQLTTDQTVEHHYDSGGGNVAVNAPGDDGSYGPNESGIFFFTTDGKMVTWNGDYLLFDQPMDVKTPVSLNYQVK